MMRMAKWCGFASIIAKKRLQMQRVDQGGGGWAILKLTDA
jgi:hypothetical protein